MRSWVRISRDAAVGDIFFKAGRTFSPGWCYQPGLKVGGLLVPVGGSNRE